MKERENEGGKTKKKIKQRKEPEFARCALIFGTKIAGEKVFKDFAQPSSYESEFLHYVTNPDGEIQWIPPNKTPEQEDRIDTTSTDIPKIPHGPLSVRAQGLLKKLRREVLRNGTMLFTTIPGSETPENRDNIKESQDNLLAYRRSPAKIRPLNDFQRFRDNDGESPFIREFCTKLARDIAAEIGAPGAETMVVYSVRYVKSPAKELRLARRGYGPGVMVVVLEANSDYELEVARIKPGLRQTGVTRN
jgi:hypothetical protein